MIGWLGGILNAVRPALRSSKVLLVKHAPEILMGMGTAGTISAVVVAAKSGPKAQALIKEAEEEKGLKMQQDKDSENNPWHPKVYVKLDWKETVKATWKVILPPALMTLASLGCFWGAYGIGVHRQAVLAGLWSTAEAALMEQQRKLDEMIGKQGREELNRAIAEEKAANTKLPQNTIVLQGGTDMWCIIDGIPFRSSYLKIKDAQNMANHQMFNDMYLSEADLYWLLDPNREYLKPGPNSGMIGWSVDKMLVLNIESCLGPDHEPMLVVDYQDKDGYPYPPQAGYWKSM